MFMRTAALYGIILLFTTTSVVRAQSGIASIYAYSGGDTASGEPASPRGLTAAHPTLAFGTIVRVTNRLNNYSVVVRINDRGPFVLGRIIDLTPAAAKILGIIDLAPVTLEVAHGWQGRPFNPFTGHDTAQ